MPLYKHDCNGCIHLGTEDKLDFYYCAKCDGGTIIARWSSRGPDYASTPLDMYLQYKDTRPLSYWGHQAYNLYKELKQ